MNDSDTTATLVNTRLVRADAGDRFDRWADRLAETLRSTPGAVGSVRLDQPGGLVHFVHRFRAEDDLRRWSDSPERRALAAEADAFSSEHRQTATGARISLTLPSEAAIPNWKNWLATWACAFPVTLLLNAFLGALPFDLPQFVQLAITSGALIAVLTWFVLPQAKKRLRSWLLEGADGDGLREEPG